MPKHRVQLPLGRTHVHGLPNFKLPASGSYLPSASWSRVATGRLFRGAMDQIVRTAEVSTATTHGITLGEAFRVWLRVAALSFGGPAGQIAVMHRILVEEKRWISENRFLHALNYCMLLPGPEAQQLATYIGWLMHRTLGGVIAGMLFVLPGVIAIMTLSWIYALYGKVGIAAAAFLAIFFLKVPFPIIILMAGVIGFVGGRAGSRVFDVGGGHGPAASKSAGIVDALLADELPPHARPTFAKSLRVATVWLALWLVPVFAIIATLGEANVFSQIAIFFSKMAMVTFGGAYAVLAYVAQQAVENYQWLHPGEMLDGLGMAETTPGPLIMVLQFVGFMGSFRDPGGLSPLLAGTLGGLLATWVTFTPCFLWIFLGAPFIEKLRGNKSLNAALSALTAAVVGVILNLAIWFAIHTVFRQTVPVRAFPLSFDAPNLMSVHGWALALSVAAAVAIFRFKVGMIQTLAACCAMGVVLYLAGAIA